MHTFILPCYSEISTCTTCYENMETGLGFTGTSYICKHCAWCNCSWLAMCGVYMYVCVHCFGLLQPNRSLVAVNPPIPYHSPSGAKGRKAFFYYWQRLLMTKENTDCYWELASLRDRQVCLFVSHSVSHAVRAALGAGAYLLCKWSKLIYLQYACEQLVFHSHLQGIRSLLSSLIALCVYTCTRKAAVYYVPGYVVLLTWRRSGRLDSYPLAPPRAWQENASIGACKYTLNCNFIQRDA